MGTQKSQRVSRKRRILMVLLGVSLGVLCHYVPDPYKGPCSAITKVVGIFLGAS